MLTSCSHRAAAVLRHHLFRPTPPPQMARRKKPSSSVPSTVSHYLFVPCETDTPLPHTARLFIVQFLIFLSEQLQPHLRWSSISNISVGHPTLKWL